MSSMESVWNDGVITIALLSGLGAGIVAILATVAIERLGGHLGGVIGTLPTTIIPASLGLWQQSMTSGEVMVDAHQTLERFEATMYAVPAGMCLNALFLWLWRALPQHISMIKTINEEASENSRSGLWGAVALMSIISLGLWLVGALLLVSLSREYLTSSAMRFNAGVLSTILILLLGAWATLSHHDAPRGKRAVSLTTLGLRGLCASIAVAAAVLISKTGAATTAGVAAVFPAIFWTTMASLWLSQGRAVPAGAVGPMMIGSSSVALFALSAPYLYVHFGVGLGSLSAWFFAAIGASVPSYLWVKRAQRQSVT